MALPPEHLLDSAEALRQTTVDGAIWSANSEQLNVNLLRLPEGEAIAEHVNRELDVLIVVLEGSGELLVDGIAHALGAGRAALVPRGAARAIRCSGKGPLVYFTCHRRRGGLMPV